MANAARGTCQLPVRQVPAPEKIPFRWSGWPGLRQGSSPKRGMAQHTPDSTERRGRIGDQMRRLLLILALTVSFMGVEVVGGWLSGSLALLADAGHMLSDSMAIALSLFAVWLMGMETSAKRTFGFRRAGILAAEWESGG